MSTIDVPGLLEELAQRQEDRPAVSTIALNVVAFVEGDAQLRERVASRLDELADRNVSRTLLLSCEEHEHRVCSHCTQIDDTVVTRSQQIHLAVKELGAQQLRSVTHDLLVPNVRTVLLWAGSHVSEARFQTLAELSDIVVLFSSAKDTGIGPLRELLQLRGTPVEDKLRDLAFLRLLSWQDSIATFFDDAQLAQELPHIARVEVACGSASEAYYLVGWLASRLSWNPCGKNALCNPDGAAISVAWHKDSNPRRVSSVQLHSATCSFSASTHSDADDLLCLKVEGAKARPQHCAPLHDVDMIGLVERAIFAPHTSVYADTLAMVGRLLEHEQ